MCVGAPQRARKVSSGKEGQAVGGELQESIDVHGREVGGRFLAGRC